jgi:hypothetical protein
MPFVTLTVRKPKTTAFKDKILETNWENWSFSGGRILHT